MLTEQTIEVELYDNIAQTIGNTPLVRLNSVVDDLPCQIYAKVEFFNPGGSVKDRVGWTIVEDAEQSGILKPGGTIVEATSGNTGVGLAIAAAMKGYKTIFVMPDKQSQEKISVLRAYGARVVVTPTAVEPEDPRSYYSVAKRLVEETPNAILANQYHNPVNPKTHYDATGPEIWRQTGGKITHFVAGLGTGGTISGTGKYLKEQNPNIQVVGVDPIGSILYDLHKTGETIEAEGYLTEGIGEDFLPSTLDLSIVDEMERTNDKDTFLMTRRIVREEGIFCGASCGAAVLGAVRYAKRKKLGPDDLVVVILPDSGSRYLSKVYNDDWMRENGFIDPIQDFSNATAIDIQNAKRDTQLFTVEVDTPMEAVVKIMKENDISQIPVVDKFGHLEGIVSEIDLLSHLLDRDHDHQKGEPVSQILDRNPIVIPSNEKLDSILKIFNEKSVVVIADNRHIEGILTKIDILDFLSTNLT